MSPRSALAEPGASRPYLALAVPKREVTIPDFDDVGEYHYTTPEGRPRAYTTHTATNCAFCGSNLPQVIAHIREKRVTYHGVNDCAVALDSLCCDACARILEPEPLIIKIAGAENFFGPLCCTIARVRKYADVLWAKDQSQLSDEWEAWAARMIVNNGLHDRISGRINGRDHNPDTCAVNIARRETR